MMLNSYKKNIKKWAKDLFPLNRSLAGKYNRLTINYIKNNINKNFKLKGVKSGTKICSWTIPKEYSISKALLKDQNGNIVCDFKNNNLHVLGSSSSINKWFKYSELKKHIFTSEKVPTAIPYVTSYYQKNWGFCMSKEQFKRLNKKQKYKAEIKSKFFSGTMNYSELVIKGKSDKEILICSYICHPSLANNELSGILGICLLSKMIKKTKYTIRLLLIPETIGAIYYINKRINSLKKNLIAGFNLTCIGLDGPYTLISSINENTYADKIVRRVGAKYKKFKILSFDKRGSNERQFGCQNLNLPFVTICRKRFGEYKEYHTSDDNLKILNYNSIFKTIKFIKKIITEINNNKIFTKKKYCEPFLAKKNLIKNLSTIKNMKNKNRFYISSFLAYTDHSHDLRSLAEKLKISKKIIEKTSKLLLKNKLIEQKF
jgi:aminopeptidase-like protein